MYTLQYAVRLNSDPRQRLFARSNTYGGSLVDMKVFIALLTGLALALALAAAERKPWFTDITHQAGIHHRHTNRVFHNPYAAIMSGYTALGAAVAAGDY